MRSPSEFLEICGHAFDTSRTFSDVNDLLTNGISWWILCEGFFGIAGQRELWQRGVKSNEKKTMKNMNGLVTEFFTGRVGPIALIGRYEEEKSSRMSGDSVDEVTPEGRL
ncbi:hypothetical protein AVEN_209063-1 [Araneus ventricosus]|uniref:Uncharacterized protein n=1 Tax=Araneus ventricosus TaxID=182803 RepID=A0A4Y2TJL0_ARAVE|nr:hypothetical protein AVEN_209063-1 [Araneus ventricosus]